MEGGIAETKQRINAILHELIDESDDCHGTVWKATVQANRRELYYSEGKVDIEAIIRRSGIDRIDGDAHRGHG
ncbi:hypothetical protein C8N35_1011208 [Breoghania corrubedonensis]|uniref:Uncharacterized protein n=1 Tax=Breoghania corrubedonensis TaxID=665038 RepID=A0A2T5VHC9_9HYPH|nr:hypothetical protein C8N35_1011208 [Breoghania corrubedonensis]